MQRADLIKRLERIQDLPTLPAIVMEVNQMLLDASVTIERLGATIEKDQAIVSKLLKLVNSAFFGLRFKVNTVPEAVVVLGFNSVRNVVVSVSVIKAFSGRALPRDFHFPVFWEHSIAVAMVAKTLALRSGLLPPDDAFLAGLLHDMGKIVQCQYFPEIFESAWNGRIPGQKTYHESEQANRFTSHAAIGAWLARKWRLPERLADAIQYHHAVRDTVSDYPLLLVTHLANLLVNGVMGGRVDRHALGQIHPDALKRMQQETKTVNAWLPSLKDEIRDACSFFLEND